MIREYIKNNLILLFISIAFLLHVVHFLSGTHRIWHISAVLIFFGALLIIYKRENTLKNLSKENVHLMQVLKQIFDHCPDSIFIKDTDKKFIAVNDAMIKLFGAKSEKDFIGKTDFDILPHEIAGKFDLVENKILTTLESDVGEFKYAQGEDERYIYFSKVPLVGKDGNVFGLLCITRNLTDDKKCRETLKSHQQLFSSIVDNIPLCVYIRDFEGNVSYKNTYCADFCAQNGWGNMEEIFPQFYGQNRKLLQDSDNKLLQTCQPVSEQQQYFINQREIYFSIHKIPIIENGIVTKVFVMAKDVTQIVEMEKQKETFVATLSHDLKTPTVAQIKALEFLLSSLDDRLKGEEREILKEISNSCRYMHSMISNLIYTYKYESGTICLSNQEFDLFSLLKECCSELKYLYVERQQIIKFEFDEQEYKTFADRLEIKRVMTNLLANAISYAPESSIIKIIIADRDDKMVFSVINKSSKLREETISNLFEKFASNAYRYERSGTGLGLYLSKQIIELHSGHIFAKKDNGEFIFGFELYNHENQNQQELSGIL